MKKLLLGALGALAIASPALAAGDWNTIYRDGDNHVDLGETVYPHGGNLEIALRIVSKEGVLYTVNEVDCRGQRHRIIGITKSGDPTADDSYLPPNPRWVSASSGNLNDIIIRTACR